MLLQSTQLGGTEEVAVVVSVVPSGAGVEGIKMAGTDATSSRSAGWMYKCVFAQGWRAGDTAAGMQQASRPPDARPGPPTRTTPGGPAS
jgi:hypothetical protein